VFSFLLAFPPITLRVPFPHYSCYMPHPLRPPRIHHSNYAWLGVQVTKLFVKQFSPTFHFSSLFHLYLAQQAENKNNKNSRKNKSKRQVSSGRSNKSDN
jgi:hypothetical protein